ncbi:MAG: (Na+)-NQR maturation NqrM [Methylococcaceae bacterium]|nr:MAG: (Na+)-NQR maturation NqrM [Methylococcaceae bacterium]
MGTMFLISFAIIAVVFLIMAVGVMFGRHPIRGSCGGHGGGECVCSEAKQEVCENRKQRLAAEQDGKTPA